MIELCELLGEPGSIGRRLRTKVYRYVPNSTLDTSNEFRLRMGSVLKMEPANGSDFSGRRKIELDDMSRAKNWVQLGFAIAS